MDRRGLEVKTTGKTQGTRKAGLPKLSAFDDSHARATAVFLLAVLRARCTAPHCLLSLLWLWLLGIQGDPRKAIKSARFLDCPVVSFGRIF